MSVLMTLSDRERRNVKGQISQADLFNKALPFDLKWPNLEG